jgi:pimeloyl-ACP methyl ester carboxylesterase
MRLYVHHRAVNASDGGVAHVAGRPLVVFLHGAGMDRSVWALQSRGLAHRGFNALAVDLPGHGGSEGPALGEIGALAHWTRELIAAAGATTAALVGHSMGGLVALETAAHFPAEVAALALVGVAAKMPVHPDLLAAAEANLPEAVDMVSLWGLGGPAVFGGAASPGAWMLGGARHLLANAAPGVLHADLAACNAYAGALAAAAKVACPTTLILGERDQMTPLKGGKALAQAIPGAEAVVLAGAGHMLPIERPAETLAALKRAFTFLIA